MARYIDADKAVEEARLSYCKDCNSYNGVRCSACGFDDAMTYIEDAPTADVEEVRHGEWIPVQYTYFGLKRYECSECKDDEYWQKRYIEHKESYCPNCGAKMDGGKTE